MSYRGPYSAGRKTKAVLQARVLEGQAWKGRLTIATRGREKVPREDGDDRHGQGPTGPREDIHQGMTGFRHPPKAAASEWDPRRARRRLQRRCDQR